MTPIIAFERLFFAVFGQTSPDDINSQRNSRPEWTENLFKIVYGIYMLVSVIVLINLLIAMMSDTYQRIQVITGKTYFCFSLSISIPTQQPNPTSSKSNYSVHDSQKLPPEKHFLAFNQSE
jgi:Ion transport protein